MATTAAQRTHVGRFSRIALKRFPAGHEMAWHAHPYSAICVLLRGRMLEAADGGGSEVLAPGTLIYKPAGLRHRNVFGPDGAEVLSLELDDAGVDLGRGPVRPPDRATTHRSAHARRLGEQARHALGTGRDDEITALILEGLGLELIAEASRAGRASPPAIPGWLRRVRERIAGEFAMPHTIRDYAADAGVHPSYLARTFRAHYGESIGRHVRGLRIAAAARALAETDAPVSRIALSAGFADQSHFTHAFTREMGTSPGAYRRRTRGG
jgi:AraC family transcriptional regulator